MTPEARLLAVVLAICACPASVKAAELVRVSRGTTLAVDLELPFVAGSVRSSDPSIVQARMDRHTGKLVLTGLDVGFATCRILKKDSLHHSVDYQIEVFVPASPEVSELAQAVTAALVKAGLVRGTKEYVSPGEDADHDVIEVVSSKDGHVVVKGDVMHESTLRRIGEVVSGFPDVRNETRLSPLH